MDKEEDEISFTLKVDQPNISFSEYFYEAEDDAENKSEDKTSEENFSKDVEVELDVIKDTSVDVERNDKGDIDESANYFENPQIDMTADNIPIDINKKSKKVVIEESSLTQVMVPSIKFDLDLKDAETETSGDVFDYGVADKTTTLSTVRTAKVITIDEPIQDVARPVTVENKALETTASQTNENLDTPTITFNDKDEAFLRNEDSKKRKLSGSNLSPKLLRKRAIRLPANKRHSATIMKEDLLAAYDIIDRTDIKNMEVSPTKKNMVNFATLAYRLKRAFSGDSFELANKAEEKVNPARTKVAVTLSLERTNDGEQIQIITLGEDVRKRNDSMTIYINDFPSTPQMADKQQAEDLIESDNESNSSSINLDDDVIDGACKKDDDDTELLVKDDNDNIDGETEDDVTEMKSGTINARKVPNRMSKTFTAADRARPSQEGSRRTTLGGAELKQVANEYFATLPFIGNSNDLKKLRKKTFSQEKFLMFTDGFPITLPSYPSDRRSLIALEIYTTERTFVRGLEVVVMLFKRQISENNLMDPKEIKIVFSNIDCILDLNKQIFDNLFERISTWSDEQMIADIFLNFENDFKIYSEFCTNYDQGEAYLKQKQKKKKDLDTLLNNCYMNPVSLPGLTLSSYMITVIQRIPRYILLFRDLLKRTAIDHPDYQNIQKAGKMMEKVASYLNEQLKQSQCAKALEALQTQITGLKAYFTPDRNLVHEGYVSLLSSKKTYQCVLFNDLLVFAIKGTNKQSSVELALDLKTVWVEDLQDLDPQTTKSDAIALYTPDRPYTMYVGKSGEKSIWMNHLKMAIARFLYDINGSDTSELDTRETSHTYADGSVYSGTFYKAKRHGEGTMMWPNQMTYRGEWLDDERNGFGVLEYLNGDIYEGQWMDDKQDGLGTFKYKNGDTLSGEWKNGFRDGQIAINYKNGDRFIGQCSNDRIEGVGELTCTNGFHYAGQWRRNLKHGKGKLTTPEGAEYSGYFLRGKYHGKGELIYPDSSIYKGEFERGERCGQGNYTVPGHSTYEGQWMHDLKDGRGKMTYENGDEYDGTWVLDMRIGQGVMFYNYGGCYRGQWQSDLKHGNGLMEFRDGRSYDGEWNNNAMQGSGTMKFKHGDMYKGGWKDNQPHGKGILTKPGGWYCDGSWLQGKQHGYCALKDSINKYDYEGEWSNGLKEGHGIEKTRLSVFEGEFVDDLRDGYGKETFPDNSTYEGYWSQAQKHGNGTRKLNNGVTERQIWTHGCLTKSPILLSPRDLPILQRFL